MENRPIQLHNPVIASKGSDTQNHWGMEQQKHEQYITLNMFNGTNAFPIKYILM